ncbi:protease SohB [Moritella viscosa]|uniref:SohB protein, peptidase U7 family n=1 Tax=Moritella viscosa TaxID=80854 RepID=A0A1L0DK25_9GAMM|nr:protease SohB [Moritella viscosa]SGY85904.1 SohB protein, peptidase U7 family [Moritella viscosa]SGY88686.1 SohB protein, peptidase U7 family [Moritella viscosa]SGY89182.1 SohB protein, peptidase U7 family [Moritella viscosa]SHO00389.1 SohB protein, peptidase U7 family [Moritella viscosa]SHO00597.1 SohB protein, peptidase U7 family [Moritella viscosa]
MEFLNEYGIFLAKTITFVLALLFVVVSIINLTSKQKKSNGRLEITNLSEQFKDVEDELQLHLVSEDEAKILEKEQHKAEKKKHKDELKAFKKAHKDKGNDKDAVTKEDIEPRLFVLDFTAGIDAKEVASLREEITAILFVANEHDEVLVRLESGGGVVHGYGLASSQLERLKQANIKLTIAVDKVAASGGYMMACIADHIIAAPFSIVGSIGVVAQIPNFNRLLKKNNIDVEQLTAGEFKRTLTMFGENDDAGREKFQQELEETHVLFKNFVSTHRPDMDIEKIATGEHWFGTHAHERGLVDTLQTSDDYLLKANKSKTIYIVKYVVRKKLAEKLAQAASMAISISLNKFLQQSKFPQQ